MTSQRRLRLASLLTILFLALLPSSIPSAAGDVPLPADADGIGPGSLLRITKAGVTTGCTANFIWQSGGSRYVGTAGHCLEGGASRVQVCLDLCMFGAATNAGNAFGSADLCNNNCSFPVVRAIAGDPANDFGLIPIPPHLHPEIRPQMPLFGAFSGTGSVGTGTLLCHYGNGLAAGETFLTKGRTAVGVASSSDVWLANGVTTPSDSGSPVVSCRQSGTGFEAIAAVGIQTHTGCTLGLTPGASCGPTIQRAIAIAASQGVSISLVS